jgi:hypothetical protein
LLCDVYLFFCFRYYFEQLVNFTGFDSIYPDPIR